METIERLSKLLVYDAENPLLFSSGFFLWWFTVVMAFYICVRNRGTVKIVYLTLVSYYFYYKSGGMFFYLLAISTVIDYFAGIWLHKLQTKTWRVSVLLLSLFANLGLLAYFKYTNFFAETLNHLSNLQIAEVDIFLPVGISFYTFQTLSYTIDIYRKKLEPTRSIIDFAFFVSFFPQLVAGPIVRASVFLPQIRMPFNVTREDLGRAVFLIATGLFKKAVISDYISVNFVDRVFEQPLLYTGFENLMAVYGYAVQIYCDFSGYSDMAIGLALLMGFKLPDNFNAPYKAASVTEFWRRWHISLSSWLRDYLYIPLGGNRTGRIRTYINLLITMLLGGLWHGAAWKFVVWGGLHGLALTVEKLFNSILPRNRHIVFRGIGIMLTFHFVCFTWIFFRADGFNEALIIIERIAMSFSPELILQVLWGYKSVVFLIVLALMLHFSPARWDKGVEKLITLAPLVIKALLVVAVIWLVVQVKSADVQPFIYFRF